MLRPLTAACALALAFPAAAHQAADQPEGAANLHLRQHAELGPYLVDEAGSSLYLFEEDTQGTDGVEADSACHEDCAKTWPPLITEGEPQAYDELDAALVGTVTREDGDVQVTYNGWPLYYYSADQMPGHTRGHDIELDGGEWYLVTPEGEEAGEEH